MESQISTSYLQNLLHETEEKLRGTNQELSELRRGLDAAVIVSVSNLRGEIVYANPLMCKITGYAMEEIIGNNHRMFQSGHHPRSFFRELWETVVRGKIWKGEIKNMRKDGSYFWVDTTIVPFADAEGKVYQFMSFRKDITERKNAEERAARENAARDYAARLAAVGEVASNIAHEIRNPLAAILLKTQLAKRQASDPSHATASFDQIESLARRIEKIIDSVRRQARDGSQDAMESVNLRKLIQETVETMGARFEQNNVRVLLDPVPDKIRLMGRPTQLSQVILNLVSNAFDAARTLPEKWVQIGAKLENNNVSIFVTDSGSGIDHELAAKIMQPYFTTKPVGKGTGLGLSISKKIVEDHGGDLFVDSTAKNTTFVARFPIH